MWDLLSFINCDTSVSIYALRWHTKYVHNKATMVVTKIFCLKEYVKAIYKSILTTRSSIDTKIIKVLSHGNFHVWRKYFTNLSATSYGSALKKSEK